MASAARRTRARSRRSRWYTSHTSRAGISSSARAQRSAGALRASESESTASPRPASAARSARCGLSTHTDAVARAPCCSSHRASGPRAIERAGLITR
jgi:hypothetical protein